MDNSNGQIVSFIWSIADDILRDVFLRGQYRDVILPMFVLRRLDALLEPTKDAVLEEVQFCKENDEELDESALRDITGLAYYNTSKWTLGRLKSQASDDAAINLGNFNEYLNGFSQNVRDVIQNFEFYQKAKKLSDNDKLLGIIEKFTDRDINLTDRQQLDSNGLPLPPLTNVGMGTVFEELLRKFNEENNEEAGEHFTPRDAIHLLAHLVFEPVKDDLPKIISIYDPACGSGGMLTESREYLIGLGRSGEGSGIQLYGTEINPETYAICKSDLIIKGVDPKGINLGNTITVDNFASQQFGYMITNPPYGKSWKTDKDKIYHDKELCDSRFECQLANFDGTIEVKDCTPRTSDGQLLFMLEEIDKMKPLDQQPQGCRIASIHNGSSLFTGDADSGESNIRRYVVENDYVDAIIQLPNNIFYNTGIATYVWILTNKKADNRRGRVQLIDASQAFVKLRKNQGNRNCEISPDNREAILRTYMDFVECDADNVRSKIFDNDDFRFNAVTVERPLRLRSQFSALRIDELRFDGSELSQWLYETYGDAVYTGLTAKTQELKQYFQDNDLKVTDKQLAKLIDRDKWIERRDLMEAAQRLMHEVGTEVFMDYNVFAARIEEAAKRLKLDLKAAALKTIARAMSDTDPESAPVIAKRIKANAKECVALTETFGVPVEHFAHYGLIPDGKGYVIYEPDSNLRDTEKIPVKEDIYEYFSREVLPYVADAWIAIDKTKIGCEISFNKYFYRPVPLRSLDENEAEIRALYTESDGFIAQLLNMK